MSTRMRNASPSALAEPGVAEQGWAWPLPVRPASASYDSFRYSILAVCDGALFFRPDTGHSVAGPRCMGRMLLPGMYEHWHTWEVRSNGVRVHGRTRPYVVQTSVTRGNSRYTLHMHKYPYMRRRHP